MQIGISGAIKPESKIGDASKNGFGRESEPAKICDLSSDCKNIEIEAEIVEKGEIREVNTRYGKTTVVNTTIDDGTGTITLVVWGENCEKISEGDRIKLKKAYVSQWNGENQLNVGRFGKLLILN